MGLGNEKLNKIKSKIKKNRWIIKSRIALKYVQRKAVTRGILRLRHTPRPNQKAKTAAGGMIKSIIKRMTIVMAARREHFCEV